MSVVHHSGTGVSRLRIALAIGLASANALAVLAACSSDAGSVDGTNGDATAEGSSSGNNNNTNDAKASDAISPQNDGGNPVKEGGNCTPVKGDCDLVLQNCPNSGTGEKQECVVTQDPSNALKTSCIPVQPSQQLPIGKGCCAGATNPCLPGLTCVGDPCTDGGPLLGRCSPTCCKGDDTACGKSDPEGIGGQCNLTLISGSTEVANVCSYSESCKPYGIEPCKASQICIVEDKFGTADCVGSNNIAINQPCNFANDCVDGLICVPNAADAGTCQMYCLTPNSNPPFDASAATGGPFKGGCPAGQMCTGPHFQDLPDWLQLCE